MEKDEATVRQSYLRRGEVTMEPYVGEWLENCRRYFVGWPWAKVHLQAERIIEAARLVRPATDYGTDGWDAA